MYCSKCGKEIKDDTRFCPYCGAPVKAAPQQTTQFQPRSDTTTQNRARYHVPDSNPASGRKVKIRTAFVYPLLGVLAYFLFMLILAIFLVLTAGEDTVDDVLITIADNAFFTVVLAILFFRERKRTGSSEICHPLKLGLFGWLCLVALFIMMFWTSEAAATVIFVTVEKTNMYAAFEGNDLLMYNIMAVSIGPVAEELIFRWMCYHSFRKRWSFWPSVILSGFLFTAAHGTLTHIPITVALSLLTCILYEVTGQFRWCIIVHLLFNIAAELITVGLGIGAVPMIILWVMTIVFMIFLWQFRDFFFNKVFCARET